MVRPAGRRASRLEKERPVVTDKTAPSKTEHPKWSDRVLWGKQSAPADVVNRMFTLQNANITFIAPKAHFTFACTTENEVARKLGVRTG